MSRRHVPRQAVHALADGAQVLPIRGGSLCDEPRSCSERCSPFGARQRVCRCPCGQQARRALRREECSARRVVGDIGCARRVACLRQHLGSGGGNGRGLRRQWWRRPVTPVGHGRLLQEVCRVRLAWSHCFSGAARRSAVARLARRRGCSLEARLASGRRAQSAPLSPREAAKSRHAWRAQSLRSTTQRHARDAASHTREMPQAKAQERERGCVALPRQQRSSVKASRSCPSQCARSERRRLGRRSAARPCRRGLSAPLLLRRLRLGSSTPGGRRAPPSLRPRLRRRRRPHAGGACAPCPARRARSRRLRWTRGQSTRRRRRWVMLLARTRLRSRQLLLVRRRTTRARLLCPWRATPAAARRCPAAPGAARGRGGPTKLRRSGRRGGRDAPSAARWPPRSCSLRRGRQ